MIALITPLLRPAKNRVPRGFSLGSHSPAHKTGFSPWGMLFVCAASFFSLSQTVQAQTPPCGLSSITEGSKLTYPPIAKAARMQGAVVLMVTFKKDGSVESSRILTTPFPLAQFMANAATDYVKSWRANPYSGPRECPIVIQFEIGKETDNPKTSVTRLDVQHIRITAEVAHPTILYSTGSR